MELSTRTKQHVTALFGSSDCAEAERLLASDCAGNLPLVHNPTPSGLERLRFAAIRLSGGSLPRLRDAIKLAKTDWRDLLVASDFAHDVRAHERWQPRRLEPAIVDSWIAGDLLAGVKFGRNAPVKIRFGPSRDAEGKVISLTGLEPEPRFLIELASGEDVEELQCVLEPAD